VIGGSCLPVSGSPYVSDLSDTRSRFWQLGQLRRSASALDGPSGRHFHSRCSWASFLLGVLSLLLTTTLRCTDCTEKHEMRLNAIGALRCAVYILNGPVDRPPQAGGA